MHPGFEEMLRATGDPRLAALPATLLSTEPQTSIRLNPAKPRPTIAGNSAPTSANGSAISSGLDPVAWWPDGGRYLTERPRFTFDPELHQGRYYVQEASSMITSAVARALAARLAQDAQAQSTPASAAPLRPVLWLDACAAPGGKTLAALDGLPAGSVVVANEYDFQRAEILRENVAKWGSPYTVVTRGDTARFRSLEGLFDVVAVDAPCSGEGMMRKDAVARDQWTPRLVEECAARQREILANLWEALRPGGYLVYSTCTFNTTENEAQVAWLRDTLGALPLSPARLLADAPNIASHAIAAAQAAVSNTVLRAHARSEAVPSFLTPEMRACEGFGVEAIRFIPGLVRGEGLFMAILQKPAGRGRDLSRPYNLPEPTQKENGRRRAGDSRTTKAGKGAPNAGKNAGKGAAKGAKTGGGAKAAEAALAWLVEPEQFAAQTLPDGSVRLLPLPVAGVMPRLSRALQVIAAGIDAATLKGTYLIPTQPLALSTALRPDAFPTAEVDTAQALAYLSRDAVTLPADIPRGFVLLTYRGAPLGFVKNLGNRTNNLYPKEWRIKSRQ